VHPQVENFRRAHTPEPPLLSEDEGEVESSRMIDKGREDEGGKNEGRRGDEGLGTYS
jgi:hypothetical protein